MGQRGFWYGQRYIHVVTFWSMKDKLSSLYLNDSSLQYHRLFLFKAIGPRTHLVLFYPVFFISNGANFPASLPD